MVNTFLIDPNFKVSAGLLDKRRLGKQRVEAYQILQLIYDLNTLANYFKIVIPDKSSALAPWIKLVSQTYKKSSCIFVRHTIVKENNDKIEHHQIVHCYNKNDPNFSSLELPKDHKIIKLGFVNHPALRMWYHYPIALQDYINAHILEWISRGYENNMVMYNVPTSYERPAWTYDTNFHQVHRSALLNKEITRKEPPWYQKIDSFKNSPPFIDYLWPVN
jgi:hypothetical protein